MPVHVSTNPNYFDIQKDEWDPVDATEGYALPVGHTDGFDFALEHGTDP